VGADTASFVLLYDRSAKTWTPSTRIHGRVGALQPALAQLDVDHLIAYCRRGGGYGPTSSGFIIRSESADGGRTWSEGRDTKLPNPNAAVDLLRLANGHLLLIYNNSMHRRTPLTAALSTNGDLTYPFRRDIATGDHDYAYPYAIQTRDGKIHIVFTSEKRTVINHAAFDESAIASMSPVQDAAIR
jgi:predicted neuraminidase